MCSQNSNVSLPAASMNHDTIMTVTRHSGAMHVARIKSSHVDRQGRRRDYQSVYLRRSFRDGGKVKHEQLANLSALPEPATTAIEAVLAGHSLAPVDARFQITRS